MGVPDLRRIQYTIRETTAAVALAALLCFGLRVAPPVLLTALTVIITGSASGAAAQRLRGGGGILGGAAGGAMAYMGLLAVNCLWLYLSPKYWIAEPVKALLLTALLGAGVGFVAGFLVRTWRIPLRSGRGSNR
jgi:hypothetical protein